MSVHISKHVAKKAQCFKAKQQDARMQLRWISFASTTDDV